MTDSILTTIDEQFRKEIARTFKEVGIAKAYNTICALPDTATIHDAKNAIHRLLEDSK